MPWPTVGTLRSLDQLDKVTAVTYDAAGNQLTVRDSNNVGANMVYDVMSNYGFPTAGTTYDFEDRLTGFQRAATSGPALLSQSWSLSTVGDWNSVTTNGTAQTRTHGPTHELLTAGGQSVNTDVKGNMTLLPSTLNSQPLSLNYDADNKLRSVDVGNDSSVDVNYQYDALGRRVARAGTGGSVVYVQADQQTIADYPLGGAPSTPTYRYVYASYIDEPVVRKGAGTSGTVHYYHRNQQYSIYAITDAAANIVERYAYTAYGQPTILDAAATVIAASAISNRYTYTAREWDATIGLYHLRARWMSGLTGRFLSRDPIGFAGSPFNLYEFLHAAVSVAVDPMGLAKLPGIETVCELGQGPLNCRELMKARFGELVAAIEVESSYGTPKKVCPVVISCQRLDGVNGETYPGTPENPVITIYINNGINERTFARTIEHELQHARDLCSRLPGAPDEKDRCSTCLFYEFRANLRECEIDLPGNTSQQLEYCAALKTRLACGGKCTRQTLDSFVNSFIPPRDVPTE